MIGPSLYHLGVFCSALLLPLITLYNRLSLVARDYCLFGTNFRVPDGSDVLTERSQCVTETLMTSVFDQLNVLHS